MKKIIATVVLMVSMVASSFAWETFAEYEMFCMANGIEPSYEEYEYYADRDGQCFPTEDEEKELDRIMSNGDN